MPNVTVSLTRVIYLTDKELAFLQESIDQGDVQAFREITEIELGDMAISRKVKAPKRPFHELRRRGSLFECQRCGREGRLKATGRCTIEDLNDAAQAEDYPANEC